MHLCKIFQTTDVTPAHKDRIYQDYNISAKLTVWPDIHEVPAGANSLHDLMIVTQTMQT